jgi:hypothetical protein
MWDPGNVENRCAVLMVSINYFVNIRKESEKFGPDGQFDNMLPTIVSKGLSRRRVVERQH